MPIGTPLPLDPDNPGDAESDFGVPRDYQRGLARAQVPPELGGHTAAWPLR